MSVSLDQLPCLSLAAQEEDAAADLEGNPERAAAAARAMAAEAAAATAKQRRAAIPVQQVRRAQDTGRGQGWGMCWWRQAGQRDPLPHLSSSSPHLAACAFLQGFFTHEDEGTDEEAEAGAETEGSGSGEESEGEGEEGPSGSDDDDDEAELGSQDIDSGEVRLRGRATCGLPVPVCLLSCCPAE